MKKEIYFIYFFIFIFIPCTTAKTATSGPFTATVIRVQKCNKTTYPVDMDPPILLDLEVYQSGTNHYLLRGNHTVVRENKQVKLKVKSFVWRYDRWKMTYLVSNLGCHSMLLDSIFKMAGLKYDRVTCGFSKGTTVITSLDVDKIQHLWTSKMEYGKVLWISEAIKGISTYYCWEYETLISPLDN